MVNLKFHFYYFALKVSSLMSPNFFFSFSVPSIILVHLFSSGLVCCQVPHFHMGYYTSFYIFCMKYFSTFSHMSSLSTLIISHCEVFHPNIFSIRIINLNFTFIFSGVLLKRNMLELSRQVCETQPLTLRRP